MLAIGTLIPASESVGSVPSVSGDGITVELFNHIGGGSAPSPSNLTGKTADGTALSPYVDFPNPGTTINVGSSFNTFFASTTTPPASVSGLSASNFIMRISTYLAVSSNLDINASTPEIDVPLVVGSDDGFDLRVGGVFLGNAGDRSFSDSTMTASFAVPGLYPVTLLYAANAVGYSGLELAWEPATTGQARQIVPQSAMYRAVPSGDELITFEELSAGTSVTNQYANRGVIFTPDVSSGPLKVTTQDATHFVSVSPDRVYGDATGNASTGVVDWTFVVPGTSTPATTDSLSFYVIDAESTGATVTAYDPDGNALFSQAYHGGQRALELVTISTPRIARVHLTLGSETDTVAVDNVQFKTPTELNHRPVMQAIVNQAVDEFSALAFNVVASDADAGQALTYSLDAEAPAGATINPTTGAFSWTPSEAQGPGVYSITARITDNGPDNLSASSTFTVTVNEVNRAPTLVAIPTQWTNLSAPLTLQATAQDADLPAQALMFTLDPGAPADTSINATTGLFTFNGNLPDGTYPITARVTDSGSPPQSAAASFNLVIDTHGPRLLAGNGLEQAPLSARVFRFSEAVDEQSVLNCLPTLTGPGGVNVPLTSASGSGTTFSIGFDAVVTPGLYTFIAHNTITDLSGNEFDQNQDGTPDAPTDTFTLLADVTPPAVTEFGPSGALANDVWQCYAKFSEAINTSISGSALSIIGPSGAVDSSSFTITAADRTMLVILPTLSAEGTYQVSIGPNVADLAGNPMAIPFHATFVIDKTPPTVVSVTPSGAADMLVDHVDLTFSEPIRLATLWSALSLKDPAGDAIGVGSPYLVQGNTYRVPFAAPHANGSYSLGVGTTVCDIAGNSLASPFSGGFVLALPDLTVSNVAGPATAVIGAEVQVTWTVANAGTATTGPWSEALYLVTNGVIGAAQPLKTFTYSTLGTRTETVTIPAGGAAGDLRFVVVADSGLAVFESNEDNNTAAASALTTVPATLTLALPFAQVSEDAANPAEWAVVTRNGDLSAPLTVDLMSSDPAHVSVPGSVTIYAGQSSVGFPVTVIPDHAFRGTQTVSLNAAASGFAGGQAQLQVLDAESPSLTLSFSAAQVTEGGQITATLRRDYVTSQPLSVSVWSSKQGQLDLPQTVTIAGGQASLEFTITTIGDQVPENTETLQITASSAGYNAGVAPLTVVDDDLPTLAFVLPSTTISEGAGAQSLLATVQRAQATDEPLTVRLTSSNPGKAKVPGTVVIPAGGVAVTFFVGAVDNALVDGPASVTISAVGVIPSCGCAAPNPTGTATALLTVTDNDGRSLTIAASSPSVREGSSIDLTLTRNADLSTALEVALVSSDVTELTVPAYVSFLPGQATCTVTAQAAQDFTVDGTHVVEVSASATGFAPAACVVAVTNGDLPDLAATGILPADPVLTEQWFNVTYRVMNVGSAPAVSSNATQDSPGTWTDRVFLSGDPYVGNDTLLGSYTFTGSVSNVPPLDFYDRTVTVRAPLKVGEYWIVVTTDLDNLVAEGVESNNTLVSSATIHVQPAYSATVQATEDVAAAGSPIHLKGQATAPYAPVNIQLCVRGMTRTIAAIADATGYFATTFTPLTNEGGQYTVGACHPGVSTAPVQDSFVIQGMLVDPAQGSLKVVEGAQSSADFTLCNLSDLPLTGLSATVAGAPSNMVVSLSVPGDRLLPGSGSVTVRCTVAASDASDATVADCTLTVHLTTNEGVVADVPLAVHVAAMRSQLVADSKGLTLGVLRGGQRVVEFSITNQGNRATGPIHVSLPSISWLSLTSAQPLASLDPGCSTTVSLLLTPPADTPLMSYQGALGLVADDSDLAVPFTFRTVSTAQGQLQVTVVDEYTAFAAGAPKVAGATVTVLDAVTGEHVTAGITDSQGQILAQLVEGYYTLQVQAADHDAYRATIFVAADQVNSVQAFVSRQAVKYVWTVTPTQIEDRTQITIEAVFETNVPAPVLTVDPPVIDLGSLTEIGQKMQIDMSIWNHGLVAANKVKLLFPNGTDPYFRYTPLVEDIGTLPAKSSLTIPVLIERIAKATCIDPCEVAATLQWSYVAFGQEVTKSTSIPILNRGKCCYAYIPTVPAGGTTGSVAGGVAGGWFQETPTVVYQPAPGVDAQVRIRISQTAVLTREAFDADLQLINSTAADLEDISVTITILDASGHDVTNGFGLLPPVFSGFTAVDGSGVVAAHSTGTADWTIIPTSDAAKQGASVYYVTGQLRYTDHGVQIIAPLVGVPITVHPQPELSLDYFLQRDVYSDDPWTDAIEPAQPFQLDVMVKNKGAGTAENLHIDSAQPKIVDNEKGLLIDFTIIATEVAGQNMVPSLTADFGDVAPGQVMTATWWMTSTLQGQFVEYAATFGHVDALGDPRLSLIKSVAIHELIHSVDAYGGMEDGKPDFLVNDLVDDHDTPDTLYLSDGSVAEVGLAANAEVMGAVTPGSLQVQLSADMPAGWSYLYLKGGDPGGENYRLVHVIRSDNVELPADNFWQTDRTFIEQGQRPIEENSLHLLDYNATGARYAYTLIYERRDQIGSYATLADLGRYPRTEALASLAVTFSEAIDPATFDWHDLTLTRNGADVPLGSAVSITGIGSAYEIGGLAGFTGQDGQYVLTLKTTGVQDLVGNAGSGAPSVLWTKATDVPAIDSIIGLASAWRSTPLEAMDVTFTKPINVGTLSAADLTLTRDGTSVALGSGLTVTQTGTQTYRITGLADATAAEGGYTLVVSAAGVEDLDGNPGVGQQTLTWTMDTTAPVIGLSGLSAAVVNTAVDGLVVECSEPVDVSTLRAATSLTRDGNPIPFTADVQFQAISGNSYRITGLSTLDQAEGQYVLSVDGALVRDWAGNAGSGTQSLPWTMDTTSPAVPIQLGLLAKTDTGVSSTDGITGLSSVVAVGQCSEAGVTVTLRDVTTNTDLGQAAVDGTSFSLAVDFDSPGTHVIRATATDAAGNTATASFSVFVDLANPVVKSVDSPDNLADGPAYAIVVAFSETMNLQPMIDDGSILTAVSVTSTSTGTITLAPSQFAYNPSSHTLTITLGAAVATLVDGVYEVRLDGSLLADLAGNLLLGGTSGTTTVSVPNFAAAGLLQAGGETLKVANYSVPAVADWNADGLPDLIVGEKTSDGLGKVRVYLNTGTVANVVYGSYFYAQSNGSDLSVTAAGCLGAFPRVYDWDGDGRQDLLVGQGDGRIALFLNNSNIQSAPQFAAPTWLQVGPTGSKVDINVGTRATLDIVDWNNDGRYDLVVGSYDGKVRVYLNQAVSGVADFQSEIIVQSGSADLVAPGLRSSASVVDLDGDGRKDLVIGNTDGQILFYANVGTDAAPAFNGYQLLAIDNVPLQLTGTTRARPFVTDFDGDGRLDLLVGAEDGLVRLYLGQGTSTKAAAASVTEDAAGTPYVHTFVMDLSALTASIADVSPSPRITAVDQVVITFSEPVEGFTLADLSLSLDGGENLLGSSQTLTTSDNIHWILGGLSSLTVTEGAYCLTVLPAGIADQGANVLSAAESTTWTYFTPGLDVDGNGRSDALTDGILILRYLFDPTGSWNYSDALGSGATHANGTAIRTLLDLECGNVLDVDGNGSADALTDGILILRYLFDPAGAWSYSDALGSGATRTTRATIRAYLDLWVSGLASPLAEDSPDSAPAAETPSASETYSMVQTDAIVPLENVAFADSEPVDTALAEEHVAASSAPGVRTESQETLDPQAVDRVDLSTEVERELGCLAHAANLDASTTEVLRSERWAGLARGIRAKQLDALFAEDDSIAECFGLKNHRVNR
jgi:hypothetical protein